MAASGNMYIQGLSGLEKEEKAQNEVRQFFRGLQLENAIVKVLPKKPNVDPSEENELSRILALSNEDVDELVLKAAAGMADHIKDALSDVRESMQLAGNAGSMFGANAREFPGGTVDVKMNASGKALTVQELEEGRKNIVLNMLDTMRGDLLRNLQSRCDDAQFTSRLGFLHEHTEKAVADFKSQAEDGMTTVVERYRAKGTEFFHDTACFAEAVESAARLPELANHWVQWFLEDETRGFGIHHFMTVAPKPTFLAASKEVRRLRHMRLVRARSTHDEMTIRILALNLAYLCGYVRADSLERIDEPLVEGGNETALVEHCGNGVFDAVELLLEARASLELAGASESKPVDAAARQGHVLIIERLLDARVSVNNNTASDGALPLHYAATSGSAKVAQVLLDANADVMAAKSLGVTPLHDATSAEVAKVLLSSRATIQATERQWTPLHYSSQNGHVEVLQVMLSAGANLEDTNVDQFTSLAVCCMNGHVEIAQALLSARANFEAQNTDEFRPLHLASQNGHKDLVQVLLSANADIQATTSQLMTPLHCASLDGHDDAMKILLSASADIQAIAIYEFTPLHCCSMEGHAAAAQVLINARANLEALDMDGMTPAALAEDCAKMDMAKVLRAAEEAEKAKEEQEAMDALGSLPEMDGGRRHSGPKVESTLTTASGSSRPRAVTLRSLRSLRSMASRGDSLDFRGED